jgi:hypothetical protein
VSGKCLADDIQLERSAPGALSPGRYLRGLICDMKKGRFGEDRPHTQSEIDIGGAKAPPTAG